MRQRWGNRIIALVAILAILTLVVGAQLGMQLSKKVQPPRFGGASMADLGTAQKEEVIVLVGAAYLLDQDLEKARERLDQLNAPNVEQWIANLVDRYITEGRDEADTRALVSLALGLNVYTPRTVAFLPTPMPRPTSTPPPTPTLPPTRTPTSTPRLTETPAMPTDVPSTETAAPTEFAPTDAAVPTDTVVPTDTAEPPPMNTAAPPTDTPRPRPTNTPLPRPTQPPAPTWRWAARLVGPGEEGQQCDGGGNQLIRVTVLDAAGNQISGVWVYDFYSGQYRVTGHKGDDPYWGPGEAEFAGLAGGRLCIATGDGGPCDSEYTRDLPCHDPPPVEDLWEAGYCDCCEAGITQEDCQQRLDAGSCLGAGNYMWRVEFRRSR
jgi:hypothetical protein